MDPLLAEALKQFEQQQNDILEEEKQLRLQELNRQRQAELDRRREETLRISQTLQEYERHNRNSTIDNHGRRVVELIEKFCKQLELIPNKSVLQANQQTLYNSALNLRKLCENWPAPEEQLRQEMLITQKLFLDTIPLLENQSDELTKKFLETLQDIHSAMITLKDCLDGKLADLKPLDSFLHKVFDQISSDRMSEVRSNNMRALEEQEKQYQEWEVEMSRQMKLQSSQTKASFEALVKEERAAKQQNLSNMRKRMEHNQQQAYKTLEEQKQIAFQLRKSVKSISEFNRLWRKLYLGEQASTVQSKPQWDSLDNNNASKVTEASNTNLILGPPKRVLAVYTQGSSPSFLADLADPTMAASVNCSLQLVRLSDQTPNKIFLAFLSFAIDWADAVVALFPPTVKNQRAQQLQTTVSKTTQIILYPLADKSAENISNLWKWVAYQLDQVERNSLQAINMEKLSIQDDSSRVLLSETQNEVNFAIIRSQLAKGSQFEDNFLAESLYQMKNAVERNTTTNQRGPVPVVVGMIDPTKKELAVKMKIEADFDTFDVEKFRQDMKKLRGVEDFIIEKIEKGSVKIFGKFVGQADQIAADLQGEMAANLGAYDWKEILLGEFKLDVGKAVMAPEWNREYNKRATWWEGALKDGRNRGNHPYYCPAGWKRYSIGGYGSGADFERKFEGWNVVYHGTKGSVAAKILTTPFYGTVGCWTNDPVLYVSPSIEYCAHPRYAKPWKLDNGKYVQMVLMCRVNPVHVHCKKPQTLLKDHTVKIDANFDNNVLEWLIRPDMTDHQISSKKIICYGIMLRVLDPATFKSHWWPKSWGADTAFV